jgi:C1A family cysteine protease
MRLHIKEQIVSPHDPRDFKFKLNQPFDAPLTADIIRSRLPPAFDQGDLGSCVANAMATVHIANQMGGFHLSPSRLQIYHDARALEHSVNSDNGCFGRDAIKVLTKTGTADESLWPYTIAKFKKKPPKSFYAVAKSHKVATYEAIPQSALLLKAALAKGYPVSCAIGLHESFMSAAVAASGIVPMPTVGDSEVGWHEVCLIGYTETTFLVRNSWGASWGDQGNFHIPLEYILDPARAADFFTFWNAP